MVAKVTRLELVARRGPKCAERKLRRRKIDLPNPQGIACGLGMYVMSPSRRAKFVPSGLFALGPPRRW